MKTLTVNVNSPEEARVAITLLKEITGLKIHNDDITPGQFAKEFGTVESVGASYKILTGWYHPNGGSGNKALSFGEFLKKSPQLMKGEQPIRVGEYEAEFKEDGVQVGCTFVPKKTVDMIHSKLHSK